MKRLLLASVSAAALFAAPAMAQDNTSTVNQTGNGATATVSQTGAENNSVVEQSGGATATVTQSGTEAGYGLAPPNNDSNVNQSADGAEATVNQTGELNRSTVDQDAAATDPACPLSPEHGRVREAREQAAAAEALIALRLRTPPA